MNYKILYILLSFITATNVYAQTWSSDYAKPDGSGCLTYAEDANQNRIPDFSYAGYKGGGVAIPDVPTVKTISPISGDNTSHIQDAIDAVAALPLDANGIRGALLLTAGTYEVHGQLYVNASGVVLRGEGDGRGEGKNTIIKGIGDTPHQRDLITIGGGISTHWKGQVPGTQQDITSDFVQVGSFEFDVADASAYSVGDNIIIYHPCSEAWLAAIDYGGTDIDPAWVEGAYPIIFNRYITNISGNTITIDAPVYNHLDRSLSQSYIYTYNRDGIVTNVGLENLTVDNEYTGTAAYAGDPDLTDENHVRNSVQLTQVEDAWVQNCTMLHPVLSGVRTETASRITVRNCRSWDPIGLIEGGRMYNFNCYAWSNNILFDNCHARNGRHHFVSNGTTSVSGFVVLRSISENPHTVSEGHRHWTTGMLFDNLVDFGTIPDLNRAMGFYNRGEYGSGHGWSAAHSVFWGCSTTRIGSNADIIVEQPPTAQNWAIGCFGNVSGVGPFNQPAGYIEGSNRYDAALEPASLYEAQLLCRKATVIADFEADILKTQANETITFTADAQGAISTYTWDFGDGASPASATGAGPHEVTYALAGNKSVSLTVSDGTHEHTESKLDYIEIVDNGPQANTDKLTIAINETTTVAILDNDTWTDFPSGNALLFDGTNDKVTIASGTACNVYPFTAMAWIKTTSTSEDVVWYVGNHFSGLNGNTLGIYNGKARLQTALWDGTSTRYNLDGTITINDGKWHHLVGVFESPSSRRLYVDGMLDGTDTQTLDIFTNQTVNATSLGNRDDSSPGNWFNGTIADAKLITTPLADSEVAEYMNNSLANNETNTIVGWMLDEGAGKTVSDEGVNAFTGTIDGATWVSSDLPRSSPVLNIIEQPQNGTCSLANQTLTYTPTADYEGFDSVQYGITDNTGLSSSAWIHIQVGSVEEPAEDCGETFTGDGTFYGYAGGGNCSYPDPELPAMTGAMNQIQYDSSNVCGACVEVTGPKGTVNIRIEDRCPECLYGDIDLAEDAFPYIADVIDGRVAISWKIVPCPISGSLQFYFKEGSSQWWTAVQVRNSKFPIDKFEYKANEEWVPVKRMMYNYFLTESGMGPGPYDFRITDMFGRQIIETGIPLGEQTLENGTQQFPDCPNEITQTIDLKSGWNLISTNIIPSNSSIEAVFAGLDVDVIKNTDSFWIAGQDAAINSLNDITPGAAYLVKMNNKGTLNIAGKALQQPLKIKSGAGWQMLGCPYQSASVFETHFTSETLEIIKNFEGFYEPGGTLNSISELEPGKGYFVKRK